MRSALRAASFAGLVLLGGACAQMDPPPGGPEDRTPPMVMVQEPDSLAMVPGYDRPVMIRFSERISEQQVEEAVMVSPRTSPVRVERGSREIRVSMREGWQPDRIYHVTVLPLIQDLFNNRLGEPVEIVFSTGPEIPATRLVGRVRDRISGEPEVEVRVEAIRQPDSLVYAVQSDSLGRFRFARVPEGEYRIRAFPDQNRNREMDFFEERDSASATIAIADTTTVDTVGVQLSIVLPDTTAPTIGSARVAGEGRVEIRFDDYLDPEQTIGPESVTITGPDSATVPVAMVTVGEPPLADSVPATEPAADTVPGDTVPGDTVVAVATDTVVAAATDTVVAAATDTVVAAATDTVPGDTAVADAVAADTVVVTDTLALTDTLAADTAAAGVPVVEAPAAGAPAAPAPTPAEPRLPAQLLVVQLAEGVVLVPEAEYSVRVTGIRNVVGLSGDAEGTFTAPLPPEEPQEAAPEASPDTVPTPDPVPEP